MGPLCCTGLGREFERGRGMVAAHRQEGSHGDEGGAGPREASRGAEGFGVLGKGRG